MRYCSAALLAITCRGMTSHYPLTGPALTLGAIFGILTGGYAMALLLRAEVVKTSGQHGPQWVEDLLAACDHDMVWSATQGRPRSLTALPSEHHAPEAEAAEELHLDLDQEPEDEIDDWDDDHLDLRKLMPMKFLKHLHETGMEMLQAAGESYTWGAVSHLGFRPFNALGFASAVKAWEDACSKSLQRWARNLIHAPSIYFPDSGLAVKVLQDRVRELLIMGNFLDAATFTAKYTAIPQVPRVGGATRFLALLEQRSMILGSDVCPHKWHPQILHDVTQTLRSRVRKEADRLQLPPIPLEWHIVENVLCCASKTVDAMLGLLGHAQYQG